MITNYSIGGFLPSENVTSKPLLPYHNTVLLSSGRSCFNLILMQLKPKKLFFPNYICPSMQKVLENNQVNAVYYAIDSDFEVLDLPDKLLEGEYFFYVNYLGIKNNYVKLLTKKFGGNLIIDDSQAFFRKNSNVEISFNSIRKFFGVPDGAYLYSSNTVATDTLIRSKFDLDYLRLKKRHDDLLAYNKYIAHESMMSSSPRRASSYTEYMLKHIDYMEVAKKRRTNFRFLHSLLSESNNISLGIERDAVPLYFPYLSSEKYLKRRLIDMKIYVPTLWPDLMNSAKNSSWENKLTTQLCLLPIDQRYDTHDMKYIIKRI